MKDARLIMGMPVAIEIVEPGDARAKANAGSPASSARDAMEKAFAYFVHVDEKFSTYKATSEISAINAGTLARKDWSAEMDLIFTLSEETKQATRGYFDIRKPDGSYDPSGIVKGWAIWNAAMLIRKLGFENFFVDAGGDIQPHGTNSEGKPWAIGIRNPWSQEECVKTLHVYNEGVATSGTYIRGKHIYDPRTGAAADAIASLTVIGPNVYEADRFATAAFAMGTDAVRFIESLPGFEAYMIGNDQMATMTSGFERYASTPAHQHQKNKSL